MGLRIKNFNLAIFFFFFFFFFFWRGEMKNQNIGDKLPKSGGRLGQFLNLRGEFAKKRE